MKIKQRSSVTTNLGAKREPRSQSVSPGAVSRIGTAMDVTTKPESLYNGRGLAAPMAKPVSHKSGSQGKY